MSIIAYFPEKRKENIAMVRNTMNLVNQFSKVANEKYDMSVRNMIEIHEQSKDAWEMIINSFRFGYMQGVKATKAETASHTLKGAEKLTPEQRELVTGIIATLTHEPTPQEKEQRQQERQRREQEQQEHDKHLEEVKEKCDTMTNEDYREALTEIFADIHENYKLRYFYIFITEKLRRTVTETV